MQTTLIGLAVGLIMALVTALIGPLVVDWGGYRALFEREATRLLGVPVIISGEIDVRILPSPSFVLRDVAIGGDPATAVRARGVTLELALTPLLRGEWRAHELKISAPLLRLGVDEAGHVAAPAFALTRDPDSVLIERLAIEQGRIELTDARGATALALDNLWFNGDLRSLHGPLRGEGAASVNGELYPYRLSTGRLAADGVLALRLNVDPMNVALGIETEGVLSLSGAPRFEGTLNFARPVGIAPRGSEALLTQPILTQPWRLGGKIKVTPASALMETLELQYGSEQDGIKLTGTAELKFGAQPRFDGVISARQVDLDRFAGETAAGRQPPAAVLRRLAGLAGAAFRPAIPIQIGVGIDQLMLGGGAIQNLRGDISSRDGGWTLERFEFRAPGRSQVTVSGALAVGAEGVAFTGPAEISAAESGVLAAWLEGRADAGSAARPLRLRGDVTFASDRIAIERLSATLGRDAISGRFAYEFATAKGGARLDAALDAPELDLDAATGFANVLLAGSALERPREVTLALDIARAHSHGFEARAATARLRYADGVLAIERLSVADFGGATIALTGKIALGQETGKSAAQGNLRLDLDARDLRALALVAASALPQFGERLRELAPALAPAKLSATLAIDNAIDQGSAARNRATLGLEGSAGVMRVSLRAQGNADPNALAAAELRLQGRIDADDGSVLLAALGLDRVAAAGKAPGAFTFTASGPALGAMQIITGLKADGLAASASGTMRLIGDGAPSVSGSVNVGRADLAPLWPRNSARAGDTLPVAFAGRLALDRQSVALEELTANVAGTKLRGTLHASFGAPARISGAIEADAIDAAALLAAGAGMAKAGGETAATSTPKPPTWSWPAEPFGDGLFAGLDGRIALTAVRASFAPNLVAREFRATLRLGERETAYEDINAELAGGVLRGQIVFRGGGTGTATQIKLSLREADAAAFFFGHARPPVTGKLGFDAEIEGQGLSPVALIGSLRGSGTVSLAAGQFAGLDPRAFETVIAAVDKGLPIAGAKANDRIAELAGRALDSGQLSVASAKGEIAIGAGQIRLRNGLAKGDGAEAELAGSLDLTTGALDLRIALSGLQQAAGARPDIFLRMSGPLSAPVRSIDASALTGWLTMRAIEKQARQLEAIQSPPHKPAPSPSIQGSGAVPDRSVRPQN